MRRQYLLLIAVATLALTFAANAHGQTPKTVRANVKFDFLIGDRLHPAGEYRIDTVSDSNGVLRIQNVSDTDKAEFILAKQSTARRSQTPRLIFEKYGDDYFLTKLFLDTQEWGQSIPRARREAQSEKNLASSLPSKPVKVVALLKSSH